MKKIVSFCLAIFLVFGLTSIYATPELPTWHNPMEDASFMGYVDEDVALPVLANGTLELGGRVEFNYFDADRYIDGTFNGLSYLKPNGDFTKPYLSNNYDMYFFPYPEITYLYTDISNDSTLITRKNIETGDSYSWITSCTPIEGTKCVGRVVFDDNEEFYKFRRQVWDKTGHLWTWPSHNQDTFDYNPISEEAITISDKPYEIYVDTGKEWNRYYITDGEIAVSRTYSKIKEEKYLVFNRKTREHIGYLPFEIVRITPEYLETGRENLDDGTRRLVRYKRDTLEEIERSDDFPHTLGFNYYKGIKLYEEYELIETENKIKYNYYYRIKKDKNVILEKPQYTHKKENGTEEKIFYGEMRIQDHFAVYITDFEVEFYDLDMIDPDTGEPKLVKVIPIPNRVELIRNGDNFISANYDGSGIRIRKIDPDNLRVDPTKEIYLENIKDYNWNDGYTNRINPDNTGIWFMDIHDEKLKLRHFQWNSLCPDKEIILVDEIGGSIEATIWGGMRIYVAVSDETESTVYMISPGFETKKIPLEEKYRIVTITADGDRIALAATLGHTSKSIVVNAQDGSIKSKYYGNAHIGVKGDLFIEFNNSAGQLYKIEGLERICQAIVLGYKDGCLYISDYDKIKVFDIGLLKFTDEVDINGDLYKENNGYTMKSTSTRNAILSDYLFFDYDGNIIQHAPKFNSIEISTPYEIHGNSLLRNTNGIIIKSDPCPSYSLKQVESDDPLKVSFEITNTRTDGLSDVLDGKAFVVAWGEKKERVGYENNEIIYADVPAAPIWGNLDSDEKLDIGSLSKGESVILSFTLPKPNSVVQHPEFDYSDSDDPNDLKYVALVTYSNGLLDVANSELSEIDDKVRPLFDGTPVSFEDQKAVSLTVWEIGDLMK